MPLSVSDYIKVEPEAFNQTGAFDAVLDVDSRFYVDPLLLSKVAVPELIGSHDKVTRRFSNILRLLAASKIVGDGCWRDAVRLFQFPEVKGTCIGYSRSGTTGSGWGPQLRAKVITTVKEFVDAGAIDPAIFELASFLEEGVGADRISDMIVGIIYPDLAAYTYRLFSELGAKVPTVEMRGLSFNLPYNPFSRKAIILLPRDILRPLPVAMSYDDIDAVCEHNRELRKRVNWIIGSSRKIATRDKKRIMRDTFIRDGAQFVSIVKAYKSEAPPTYDFVGDPLGETRWYQAAQLFVKNHPLSLERPSSYDVADVLKTVMTVCEQFKDLIESNGLWTELYNEDGEHRQEASAQKLFFAVADGYCKANNIDISPEPNAGRGAVDFKFSKGYNSRVIVETKLTTNQRLKHGLETQLKEYERAEKTSQSIFLVIDINGGSTKRLDEVKEVVKRREIQGILLPKLVVVDGRVKASASKFIPSD